jgi:hypothetical protein
MIDKAEDCSVINQCLILKETEYTSRNLGKLDFMFLYAPNLIIIK